MAIELTRLFLKVVQHGSFTAAAEALRVPKSTVSKAVARLEANTGTKLLLRTTRSLTLTPAGRVFYDTCLGPLQIIEDAEKSLYGHDSIVAGLLRLTAPEDLGLQVVAPVIAELSVRHPKLTFELVHTDDIVDLIKDGFDVALRIGKLSESRLRVKRCGDIVLVPVASASYLSRQDKIKLPSDLGQHDCLSISSSSASREWRLRRKKESVKVRIQPKVTCNHMTSLMRLAMTGAGVALVPLYLCREALAAGSLVRVLPEWSGVGMPLSMLTPLASNSSARLKLTLDALSGAIGHALL